MIESGIVKEIKRDKAVVVFDRKSACDKCRMCATSKTNGMKVEIVIKNTLDKKAGDSVFVQMGEKYVLTAAAIAYVIPLILVTAGILLGTLWGEIWQIVLAAVGLVGGFGIAILLDRVLRNKQGFTPVMVECDEGIVPVQSSDVEGKEIVQKQGETDNDE